MTREEIEAYLKDVHITAEEAAKSDAVGDEPWLRCIRRMAGAVTAFEEWWFPFEPEKSIQFLFDVIDTFGFCFEKDFWIPFAEVVDVLVEEDPKLRPVLEALKNYNRSRERLGQIPDWELWDWNERSEEHGLVYERRVVQFKKRAWGMHLDYDDRY